MAYRPSHALGNYAIELNGFIASWVNSIEFPTIKLNQVNSKTRSAVDTAKSGGNYSHTAYKASYSISETNNFVDWIMALPRRKVITPAGAIIMTDQNSRLRAPHARQLSGQGDGINPVLWLWPQGVQHPEARSETKGDGEFHADLLRRAL